MKGKKKRGGGERIPKGRDCEDDGKGGKKFL